MTTTRTLDALRSAAKRRVALDLALLGMPLLALLAAATRRLADSVAIASAVAFAALALLAWAAWRRTRGFDTRWLARRLDAERKDFEDSSSLLFADTAELGPLQRLQRERLQQRVRAGNLPDLRPDWSRRGIAFAWIIAIAGMLALRAWPGPGERGSTLAPNAEPATVTPDIPHLVAQALRIAPPAYTRLPVREEASLDARAPQDSRLQWRLRFEPQPASAELVFVDGRRLPLQRDGDAWIASRTLDASTLYRIVPQGAPANSRLYRLDALPDRPPQLKVIAPAQGLSIVGDGQESWELAFEAEDDYGLSPSGKLFLTLARGSGENIAFHEQQRTVAGSGGPTRRRYVARIRFAALGMAVGDDLVAQLEVHDNRAPSPQAARSPSLILRWPAPQEDMATGIDGVVLRVLPAYFRSQRQVIIDAEALLKQKRRLDADAFLSRSDAIASDQKLLRLRYGQFLGMEDEGQPQAPPTQDAAPKKPLLPTNDEESVQATTTGGVPRDEHDHDHDGAPAKQTAFGAATDVVAEYGHVHDEAEAATLLDPQTRATLKSALEQMWQSELHLRQGQPQLALPFAYKALEYIKQVQQADRIYLARVGTQLPPIDLARRMGGKRDGIASRPLPSQDGRDRDDVPARLWAALQPLSRDDATAPDLEALQRWLHANEQRVDDPLSLLAALETLRAEPQCGECRARLRAQLWRILGRPPVQVPRRDAIDAQGQRYLDALERTPAR